MRELSGRIDSLQSDMSEVKSNLSSVKDTMQDVKANYVTGKMLHELESRVMEKITEFARDVGKIATDLAWRDKLWNWGIRIVLVAAGLVGGYFLRGLMSWWG